MEFVKMARALDVHVAGWPLRVLFDADVSLEEGPAERAERLWRGERSTLRWLQLEPRGHAALRIGVVASSRIADYALLTFDSEGPCPPDAMDALCAAAALTECGRRTNEDGIAFDTAAGTIGVGAADGEGRRNVAFRHASREFAEHAVLASAAGLSLDPGNAPGLEAYLRGLGEQGQRTVLMEERDDGRRVLAVAGRHGRLLRAPRAAAVGAALAALGAEPGLSYRFFGLAGGVVEGLTSAATGPNEEAAADLDWELRARARLVASCEFVLDPGDALGEGFLLR